MFYGFVTPESGPLSTTIIVLFCFEQYLVFYAVNILYNIFGRVPMETQMSVFG